LIDAHRGAPSGFAQAFNAGYDYVEFDVRKTPSGRLVVQHDPDPPEDALPLDTLLDLAAGSTSHLHADLKEPGCEPEIVRKLLARFPSDHFVVTGPDASVLRVKAEFPDVQAGLTLGEDLDHVPAWRRVPIRLSELFPGDRVRRSRADFVAVHQRLARATVLLYCARHALPAWVWTVDDQAQIQRFLGDRRVAVLITNRPDLAARLRAGGVSSPHRGEVRPQGGEGVRP